MKNVYFLIVVLHITNAIFAGGNKTVDPEQKAKADKCMAVQQSSIGFLENKGQMVDMNGRPVPFVLFRLETPDMDIYVTEKGLSYIFKEIKIIEKGEDEENDIKAGSGQLDSNEEQEEIDMKWQLVDANLQDAVIDRGNIIPGERSGGEHYNFFYPNCPDGIYDVKKYKDVTIKNIYPGIDWVLKTTEDGIKYDFIVNPGASASQIQIQYDHIKDKDIKLLADGSVRIKVGMGTISEAAPISYQDGQELKTKFVLNGRTISFSLPDHTMSRRLDIDPQIYWSTYFGSGGTTGAYGVVVSKSGEVYIGGYTQNAGSFPLLNPSGGVYFQGVFNTGAASGGWMQDWWIAKFDANYSFVWSTYYGSNGSEAIGDMTLNNAGDLFVVGSSPGSNFPLQAKAGAYNQAANYGAAQLYLVQFNSAGIRQWATFYGDPGGTPSSGNSIDIDPLTGNILIGGALSAGSPLFNPGGGAYYQPTIIGTGTSAPALIGFTPAGVLNWSTFFAGSTEQINDIRFTPAGSLLVTGSSTSNTLPVTAGAFQPGIAGGADVFAAEFGLSRNLTWCTYLGGTATESAYGICADNGGNVFVFGRTGSLDFPLRNPGVGAYFDNALGGGIDFFISKFTPVKNLVWSSYVGGSSFEGQNRTTKSIFADNCDNIFISGTTYSTDYPALNPGCGAYLDNTLAGAYDAVFTKFNKNNSLVWSTYYGGNNQDWPGIDVDDKNRLFATGEVIQAPAPLVNPGGGAYFDNTHTGNHDAFIVRFDPVPPAFTQSQVNATGCSCNGTATINLSCGTPGYNYVWSNGNITLNNTNATNTITGLCAETYKVTAYSSCDSVKATYTITGGSGSFSLSATQNNANCNSPGSSTITPSGGTSPYTYSWMPGNQSATTATGLSAGIYTVTASDNAGCTNVTIVTIANTHTGITAGANITANISCNGKNDGSISATTVGGTGPFTYTWSPSGQTSQTATGLAAGTYTVYITDANGCSPQTSIVLTQPANLTVGINSLTNASCGGGSNGSAIVNTAGGTPGFAYLWSNGQTANTVTGLTTGNHTVTVTDAKGCSSTALISIDAVNKVDAIAAVSSMCKGDSVQLNSSVIGPLCKCGTRPSGCSGATQTAQVGTLASTFNTPTPFNGSVTGLKQIHIISASELITSGLKCSSVITKLAFNVQSKASTQPFNNFTIKMMCGTATYNDPAFVTVFNAKPISTTTGWNSFIFDMPYEWDGVSNLSIQICWSNATTSGADVVYTSGTVGSYIANSGAGVNCSTSTATSSGGGSGITTLFTFCTPPPTYSWTPPITLSNSTIANPRSGAASTTTYTLTLSGIHNCILTDTVTVNVSTCSTSPTVSVNSMSVCPTTCANLSALGSNGTAPYTYSWNTGATTQNINICPASTTIYTVKITDSGGATSTATATVTVNPAVGVNITTSSIICNGGTNGSMFANPTSGTSPFVYSWSNLVSGSTVSGLGSGIYTVTVTDSKGCVTTSTASIISPPALTGQFTKGTSNCTNCGCKEWLMVNATGGTSPYSYSWPDGYVNRYKNQLCPGNYTINLKDKNGCSVNLNLTVKLLT
ncbi:MAG: SprB repeat-containing protein [Bacteroidetes bacterium]|nr:SprB repeat-containing protein [Bacteroidota bacterium]